VPNFIKIDPYNFELYRFKVDAFFETQCNIFAIVFFSYAAVWQNEDVLHVYSSFISTVIVGCVCVPDDCTKAIITQEMQHRCCFYYRSISL